MVEHVAEGDLIETGRPSQREHAVASEGGRERRLGGNGKKAHHRESQAALAELRRSAGAALALCFARPATNLSEVSLQRPPTSHAKTTSRPKGLLRSSG